MFGGELDPEIANLMGLNNQTPPPNQGIPTFDELFGEGKIETSGERDTVDLQKTEFDLPDKLFNDNPDPLFSTSDYYATVQKGEGEAADRMHKLLSAFMKAKDNQEKSVYRMKLITAYWNFIANIAAKVYTNIEKPKRFALRYGLVAPALLQADARALVATIIQEKNTTEPIYYIDEWLNQVATGAINPSAVDETKQLQANKQNKASGQIASLQANITANKDLIRVKGENIKAVEANLQTLVASLREHSPHPDFPDLFDVYSPAQKNTFGEIATVCNQLRSMDAELVSAYAELSRYRSKLQDLKQESGEAIDENSVDNKVLAAEFDSVRQMAKMCVGKQGNHLPLMMAPYFRNDPLNLATREKIITTLKEIEDIDPELFYRTYKRERYRIVPYIILLPCYGDNGICWEPFERFNRATSRGRIAIPMYPKDLKIALLTALADLRWQIAKEKAAHYWMEEGLTGGYFQYYVDQKLKGNVKDYFIKDYLLWITKESNGIQKLDKEVRRVFWRHMPFKQELKDELRMRGFIYGELYKKDQNRAMSDGY